MKDLIFLFASAIFLMGIGVLLRLGSGIFFDFQLPVINLSGVNRNTVLLIVITVATGIIVRWRIRVIKKQIETTKKLENSKEGILIEPMVNGKEHGFAVQTKNFSFDLKVTNNLKIPSPEFVISNLVLSSAENQDINETFHQEKFHIKKLNPKENKTIRIGKGASWMYGLVNIRMVIRLQYPKSILDFLQKNPFTKDIYDIGKNNWTDFFYIKSINETKRGRATIAMLILTLVILVLTGFLWDQGRKLLSLSNDLKNITVELAEEPNLVIKLNRALLTSETIFTREGIIDVELSNPSNAKIVGGKFSIIPFYIVHDNEKISPTACQYPSQDFLWNFGEIKSEHSIETKYDIKDFLLIMEKDVAKNNNEGDPAQIYLKVSFSYRKDIDNKPFSGDKIYNSTRWYVVGGSSSEELSYSFGGEYNQEILLLGALITSETNFFSSECL